jgi:hypothetical protein
LSEYLGLTDGVLFEIDNSAYRPLRVIGGEKFDFSPKTPPEKSRGMALVVGLEELPPPSDSEGDRVDLRLSAPTSWYNVFLEEFEKRLRTYVPRSAKINGVWILRSSQQISEGGYWPIWFDHRLTGPGEMITLGIPKGRNIFPTTEDLIRSSLFAVARASVNAVQ